MTNEDLLRHKDAVIGFLNGERVEYFSKMLGKWVDCTDGPMWGDYQYRVAPKPKYRPFTVDEAFYHLKEKTVFKAKPFTGRQDISICMIDIDLDIWIGSVDNFEIFFIEKLDSISLEVLCEYYENAGVLIEE